MDEVAVSADGLTRRGQATDPSYSELLAGVRGVEFGAKKSRRVAPLPNRFTTIKHVYTGCGLFLLGSDLMMVAATLFFSLLNPFAESVAN